MAEDPQVLCPSLAEAADIFLEAGDLARATALADDCLACLSGCDVIGFEVVGLHVLAWTLTALGRAVELDGLVPDSDKRLWASAARAVAAGDLERAAEVCRTMGARGEEAGDRLRLAERLAADGRVDEAKTAGKSALDFYRSVGASRYIERIERITG
jgi:hypothetical protein